jgi:hypothetical protein
MTPSTTFKYWLKASGSRGEVIRQSDNVDSMKLANGNEVDTSAQFMRASTARPPAPKAASLQPGQPPKPGLVSCSGKFEGR